MIYPPSQQNLLQALAVLKAEHDRDIKDSKDFLM